MRLFRLRIVKKFWLLKPTNIDNAAISRMIALLETNFLTSNFFAIFVFPPYSNWVASAMMFS